MEAGAILKHTETIAAQLAHRFADDPKAELDCWVATAQQREAMVVEVYKLANLARRVPDQADGAAAIVTLVRDTIASIWAQEASHVSLMGSLRKVNAPQRLQIAGEQGTLEGLMTSWATSGGVLGKLARASIGAAGVFEAAPAFTADLQAMSMAEFFRFSAELEQTASNGYSRILALLEQLEQKGEPSGYGLMSQYEFATVLAEEQFHEAVFNHLRKWLKKGDQQLAAVDLEKAKESLFRLASKHLGLKRVRGVPRALRSTPSFLEADGDALISDGGLGPLFKQYGIPFRVARFPETFTSSPS